MKKKFFAAAITCAVMSLSLMPSAFATEGDAQIVITGAAASISAAGAFSNGLYFNTTVATTTELGAKSNAAGTVNGGTNLVNATDYIQLVVGDNSSAWTLKATGASWTELAMGGGAAYTLSTTAGTAQTNKVAVRLDTTAAGSSLARTVTVSSTTAISGKTCSVVATDVSQSARTLTTSAQTIETASTTNTDGCQSYTVKYTPSIDLTPRTGGFSAKADPTSSITFTVVD